MIQLRVSVDGIVVLNADGSPGEVLEVIRQLDEELAIVFVKPLDLLLKGGCPHC